MKTLVYHIYLPQRANLKDAAGKTGDTRIPVGDQRYPGWFDKQQQPLTSLQETMHRWITADTPTATQQSSSLWEKRVETALFWISFGWLQGEDDGNRRAVQRFALRVLAECARIAEQPIDAETAKINEARSRQRQQAETTQWRESSQMPMPSRDRTTGSPNLGLLLLSLVYKIEHKVRRIIAGLLPESVSRTGTHRTALLFVLDRWSESSDPTFKAVGENMKRILTSFVPSVALPISLLLIVVLIVVSAILYAILYLLW